MPPTSWQPPPPMHKGCPACGPGAPKHPIGGGLFRCNECGGTALVVGGALADAATGFVPGDVARELEAARLAARLDDLVVLEDEDGAS